MKPSVLGWLFLLGKPFTYRIKGRAFRTRFLQYIERVFC